MSNFFQNEEIFVQLDELDELDRITHAWIWLNFSLTQAQTRMHSSRMRTARSLIVSAYLIISHAHPPGATMHAPPPEKPRTPQVTTHTPPEQPCTPLEQPHMVPRSNHACPAPPGETTHPRATTHASPPGATMHAPLPGSNHAHAPCERNEWQTRVKTKPSQTTFADGKNSLM